MKTSTKIGIFFLVLSALVIILGIVFATLNKNERTIQENIVTVKKTYTAFSVGVVDNYQIRSALTSKVEKFINETYSDIHDTYVDLLTSYNENMVAINNNVAILEDKCAIEYEDSQTNVFCDNYQQLYEAVNNEYITNVNSYNEKIMEYNLVSDEDYDAFELVNKEYIDFNKDGIYNSRPE